MNKVSVIIPVYNGEKYIEKCINSLLSQTLTEMEFIFINDGSNDKTKEIIEKYKTKDKRIKLYNKENGGQGSARNLGIKKCQGEYIAFLDSDDYVENNMYEILYSRAKKDNLDIVICNYYLEYEDSRQENKNNITTFDEKKLSINEYITISPSPWNKIIKYEYIKKNNFNFPEGIIYEDLAAIPILGINNPNIVYINRCLYHYVQSQGSTTRNKEYKNKYEDIFKSIEYLYNNLHNKGVNTELEYLITYHFLYLANLNFYHFSKYELMNKVSDNMHKYAPKWYKNKLVKEKMSKKQLLYMKLFYNKKYFIINIYRRLLGRNDIN